MANQDKKVIKPQDIANRLDVSIETVYRWIKDGDIPAIHVSNTYRVFEEDYRNFLKNSRVVPNEREPASNEVSA